MPASSEPPGTGSKDTDEDGDLFGSEGIFRGEAPISASSRTKQAPTASPVRVELPQTWEDRFLAILNNRAKSVRTTFADATTPYRTAGFLVLTRGGLSLQRVQALCFRTDQVFNNCLTQRYRLRPPVLGNLLAALVTDLARLSQGSGPPIGDLLPLTTSLSTPPWATLRNGPFAELAAEARLDQYTGELPRDWVGRLLDVLRDPAQLPTGVRLVVFVEVDGPTEPKDWDDLLDVADRLPERVGIVLSGVPDAVHVPRQHAWDWNEAGPTGSCLEIDIGPAPGSGARAYKYVEAPLSGDTPAEVDGLDLRRYARGLARLVLLPGTGPLTIGVHAPWGRGKTSFMRFIEWELLRNAPVNRTAQADLTALDTAERELGDPARTRAQRDGAKKHRDDLLDTLRHRARSDVVPVWFNAWRYEGATQIWAGLTHEITDQMERALPWPRRVWARLLYGVRTKGAAFWIGTLVPTLVALALTVLVLWFGLDALVAPPGNQPGWVGTLAAIAPGLSVLGLGCYLVWRFSRVLAPVSERLLDYVRQPDYQEHMGYQHQVLRDIQFLMDRLGPEKTRPRVVVFIDDLDRCSDEKVLETLQAINLLLTASGCYVFLGIDTHMIAQAVARQYGLGKDKQDRARAESYLRKIIQLSFRLPVPAQDQRLALLTQFFSGQAQRDYAERLADSRAVAGAPAPPPVPGPPAPRPVGRLSAYGWSSADVHTPPVYEIADVEDTVDELDAFASLRDLVPENPRELKRLANLHRLVKILVQRPEAPPTTATQRLLVAWLVLCFVAADAAERLLATAHETDPATELHSPDLDELIARLNRDRTGDDVSVLTAADLAHGTPLAEAAAISALFQDQAAGSAGGAPPPQWEMS